MAVLFRHFFVRGLRRIMSKRVKILLILVDVILVAGLIIGILFYQKRADEKETENIGEEALSRRYTETIRYQGNEYPLNRHVTSVLLIGTDNYSDDDKQNEEDLFYKMWPRTYANAELAWSGCGKHEYSDFARRLSAVRSALQASRNVDGYGILPARGEAMR